jgi:metallothionein
MDEKKKCAHKACKCDAADGSDYCGTYCEQAKVEHQSGDGCGCGHDACPPKIGTS